MTTTKRLSIISIALLLAITFSFLTSAFKNDVVLSTDLVVEKKKTKSGYNYTIFHKNNFNINLSLKRPEKTDKTIHLCIAGAFTDLQNYSPDGLLIENGNVLNKNKINNTLGGAIKMINGDCELFPTHKGKLLTDSLTNFVVAKKGSLFQQILMIEKGVGSKYKDVKLFQRRAIVKLKGNKTAVIESYENITLTVFTTDLLELGVQDALYVDMGAWDEGWYRNSTDNKIITIGRMKTQTDKQCNWVVFKTN